MTKILLILIALSCVGCRGLDRIINGADHRPQQQAQSFDGNPYEEHPELPIPEITGYTYTRHDGRGYTLSVDLTGVAIYRVMVKDSAGWHLIGRKRNLTASPCFYVDEVNNRIEVQHMAIFQYCIVLYRPSEQ